MTVVGIVLYVLTAACIAGCIVIGLKLQPVEELKTISAGPKRWGFEATDSTQYLIKRIVSACLFLEIAVYLINSCRLPVGRAATDGRKAASCIVLVLVTALMLVLCFYLGKSAIVWGQKIAAAVG